MLPLRWVAQIRYDVRGRIATSYPSKEFLTDSDTGYGAKGYTKTDTPLFLPVVHGNQEIVVAVINELFSATLLSSLLLFMELLAPWKEL